MSAYKDIRRTIVEGWFLTAFLLACVVGCYVRYDEHVIYAVLLPILLFTAGFVLGVNITTLVWVRAFEREELQ